MDKKHILIVEATNSQNKNEAVISDVATEITFEMRGPTVDVC